jgi:Integral membrane protein possibly involved in chromosome condensation
MPIWGAMALGGALGALARWLVGEVLIDEVLIGGAGSTEFPWGTLAVNVLGCALIGVLAPLLMGRGAWLSGFAITGFLGGFTTYSAFAEETFLLLDRGDAGGVVLAAGYVLATIAATAIAVSIGSRVGSRIRAAGTPAGEAS